MAETDKAARNLEVDLELIRNAAAEAGRIALQYFRTDPDSWMKDGNSPVSEADIAVDRYLRRTLMAARPDYGWLSEESVDATDYLDRDRVFVIDPIDGTRAYLAGKETWCISIAVVESGQAVVGVLDCPELKQVYMAAIGYGATCNNRPISVSTSRKRPVIGGPRKMTDRLSPELNRRMIETPHVPSLAYRLAMIADGRMDGSFVRSNSHDWDIAAAELILREAGGRLIGQNGDTPQMAGPRPRHGALAASAPWLLPELERALRKIS